MSHPPPHRPELPHKLAVLVFLQNAEGEHLLLLRAKPPNLGNWSPIGGKLETGVGESPFECAVRETAEETGYQLDPTQLHLFALVSEKGYEGQAHWMMFLFHYRGIVAGLPPEIDEGSFGFFSRAAIGQLDLPATDRETLWPLFDEHHRNFVALKANCYGGHPIQVKVEQLVRATPIIQADQLKDNST